MPKRECLKIMKIGQSATKPRKEEGSTTIPIWEYTQASGSGTYLIRDKDMVLSIWITYRPKGNEE